ncbi:hypothetical protein [Patulibacter sp.]|uniref:hypothetical protein n=1 Tax=Patulibacter sp. TaxID=1912859 RepID=UPI0027218755|nr:hypothetical protein [Patulibacter sp.]MDO9410078.1 hypothetical protein [Patulibacter sp.]
MSAPGRRAPKDRRERIPTALPAVPTNDEFGSGNAQFAGSPDVGWLVETIMTSSAWQRVKKPLLDGLDVRPTGKRGPRRRYSAEQLEGVFVYRVMACLPSIAAARDLLTSDRGATAREFLGFGDLVNAHDASEHRRFTDVREDPVINRYCRRQRLMDKVPLEATLSRHRDRFMEEAAINALQATMTAMVEDRSAQSESFREAMRLLYVDGVAVRTARRAPILLSEKTFKKHRRGKFDVVIERQIPDAPGNPRTMYEVRSQSYDHVTGRMRGRRRPTALDAGYMGKGAKEDDPTKTP